MFNRFALVLVFVPLAIILIALAVANRAPVAFTVDPFNPGNPALTYTLPFFVFLVAAMALGMLIGSLATWFRQGRYRKLARQLAIEAESLKQAAGARPAAANPNNPAPRNPALPHPSA
jgi:uncharacterized integral membrane protein